MGLTAWMLRHTPPRPMVVACPGGTSARIAVERAVRERGWRPATGPAEANVLVVTGTPVEPYVRRVWDSLPAPAARVDVPESFDERRLDRALTELRDLDRQRERAARAADGPDGPHEIPMADRADDRDGLRLDRLHVPLGPVLPLWPAGLIVHTRLQGDVVGEASVELVGSVGESFWRDTDPRARGLDSCARLLALAGWPDMATRARQLRDDLLDGVRPAGLERWAERVRRSRLLRWLLAGVGSVPDGPEELRGDALARLHRWLDSGVPLDWTQWTVDHLPGLLAGSELAAARLTVASLDPDLDALLARHG